MACFIDQPLISSALAARAPLDTRTSSTDAPRTRQFEVEQQTFHTTHGTHPAPDSLTARPVDSSTRQRYAPSAIGLQNHGSRPVTAPHDHDSLRQVDASSSGQSLRSVSDNTTRSSSSTTHCGHDGDARTRSASSFGSSVTSVVNGLRQRISTKRKYRGSPQRSHTFSEASPSAGQHAGPARTMGLHEARDETRQSMPQDVMGHLVRDIPTRPSTARRSSGNDSQPKPTLRLRTLPATPSTTTTQSSTGAIEQPEQRATQPRATAPRRHGLGPHRPFSPISPARLGFRDISPRELSVAPPQPCFAPAASAQPPASLDQTLHANGCIGYQYITSSASQLSVTIGDVLLPPAGDCVQARSGRLERKYSIRARDQALAMPEVVGCILQQLDLMACEVNSIGGKRKLTSHARDTTKCDADSANEGDLSLKGTVFGCLYVNKVWSDAARRVLSSRVEFSTLETFDKYLESPAARDNLCRDLLVHKLREVDNGRLVKLNQLRLRSLEFYVCPELLPPVEMLAGGSVLKLALPGCSLADDALLEIVARTCPRLHTLDLRACERVTDAGVVAVARACTKLRYLNVGRMQAGDQITDASLEALCEHTAIETVGLAGCDVTDVGVMAIARHRSRDISRVSLNQCRRVTGDGITELVRVATKLKVLELVGCPRVQAYEALLEFKQSTGALVDVDSALQELMTQLQLYKARSRRGGRGGSNAPALPSKGPVLQLGVRDLREAGRMAAAAVVAASSSNNAADPTQYARARLSGIAQARAQVALA